MKEILVRRIDNVNGQANRTVMEISDERYEIIHGHLEAEKKRKEKYKKYKEYLQSLGLDGSIWERVLAEIVDDLSPIAFETWFSPMHIYDIDKDERIVYFATGEDFRTGMLNTRYIKILENGVRKALKDDYRVVIKTSYAGDKLSSVSRKEKNMCFTF
jgi:hypothetical protein